MNSMPALFNCRSERTEPRAMFHTRVDPILNRHVSRVRQDRTISKCARTDFRATLKPTEDFSRSKIARHPANELLFAESLICQVSLSECFRNFGFAIANSMKGMF